MILLFFINLILMIFHFKMEWNVQWWFYCLNETEIDEFHEWGARISFEYNIDDRKEIIPTIARTAIDIF